MRHPFLSLKRLTLFNLILLIIIFALAIPLEVNVTNKPTFCASCHEITPAEIAWTTGSHTSAGCVSCHLDPELWRYARGKIYYGVRDIFRHFTGRYTLPITTTVPNHRCEHCHRHMDQRNSFGEVFVSHRGHLQRGTACTTCHIKTGHIPPAAEPHKASILNVRSFQGTHKGRTLITCFKSGCHDGKASSRQCSLCHVSLQRIKPESHDVDYINHHGSDAKKDERLCLTCHRDKMAFCKTCHQTRNPHPAGFVQTHGDRARRADRNCFFCHRSQKEFCGKCHSHDNPHPTNFLSFHGKSFTDAKRQCAICHNQQSFCNRCHGMAMPHPANFGGNLHVVAFESNKALCWKCHTKRDCTGCHNAARPRSHTSNWLTAHGKPALKKDNHCLFCHVKKSCDSCHQTEMPHPAPYVAKHIPAARKEQRSCSICHTRQSCLECHQFNARVVKVP